MGVDAAGYIKGLSKKALPALVWVEVQSPAVEIDGGAEVLPVAEAPSRVRDPLGRPLCPIGLSSNLQ